MTPELWQRVERALEEFGVESESTPEASPGEILARVCGDDTELRVEVEAMLEASTEAEGFLDTPVWSAHDVAADPALEAIPESFGPYRVLDRIGQGGMGEVFLAERADGEFEQRVAVKWLDAPPSSSGVAPNQPDLVRRFREERQILAGLEHPNIARLIDGGTTSGGRPYLIMEYVEGERIDRWCEKEELGFDQRGIHRRLALFLKVCAAVQAAHRNLIVHRALKPSNILVDADGEPKLLDFGIAKVLSAGTQMQTETAGDHRWMTPLYASPEQVRGEPITTATDVHALGLLLYVLLAGQHPFRGEPSSVTRRIESETPAMPSLIAPAQVRKKLGGDLDAIVIKALAKNPEDRYESAAQLAEDVERHLSHQPVAARPKTPWYLAGRFMRRHRLAATLTAVLALALIVFSVAVSVLWRRALDEKSRAEEVAEFLEDLYQLPDPRRDEGSTVTALELLRRSAGSLEKELEDQPGDRALLMLAVGSAYRGLGQHEQAANFLRRGLELYEASGLVPDQPNRRLLAGWLDLAAVERALGRPQVADGLLSKALAALERGGVDHQRLAKLINNHASLLEWEADFARAADLYRHGLAMKVRLHGEAHEEVATTLNNLATTLRQQGKIKEAEEMFRRALALRLEFHGEESPRTLSTQNNLAVVLRDQGALDEAETIFRQNLAVRTRLLGPEHRALATVLNNLAQTRQAAGDFAEAAELYGEAERLFTKAYGAEHVNTAVVLRNRATLSLARDEPAEGERLIRRAEAIFRATVGESHWRVADAESVLGACLVSLGKSDEGVYLLRRATQTLERAMGEKTREAREARGRMERFAQPAA